MEDVTQEDFDRLRAERINSTVIEQVERVQDEPNNNTVIAQVERILDEKILLWKEDLISFFDEIKGLIKPIAEESSAKENSSEEDLIDVFEAARILNVSPKTMRRYYAEGKLPGFKSDNGRIFFPRENLKRFLKGEL